MKLSLAASTVGLSLLISAAAFAQTYTYNVGPNIINQSATACRADTEATEKTKLVTHSATYVTTASNVGSTSGTVRLFCPINRRGHSFYTGLGNTFDGEFIVDPGSITLRAQDNTTAAPLKCFAYRLNHPTGSQSFGQTRFLCATNGGCTSVANSYRGVNNLTLPWPSPTKGATVNFGYVCDLGASSTLYHAELNITPNP